jgi:hypothetical protein
MPFPCHVTNMHFTAGSWHGRGRVTACEQCWNGMVLCESNNSIGRPEAACWPPASVRLRAATTRSWQGSGMECVDRALKGSGTAGERHGNGMVCVNPPLYALTFYQYWITQRG